MLPRIKTDEYYVRFKSLSVTFTREVIGVTGLLAKMVNLKCGSDVFPCVIYSTSFEEAKVVANKKSGLLNRLQESNNVISLRFCFKLPATDEQVAFLVPSRIINSVPYGELEDMTTLSLQFTQRPPDDLIEIMGRILESSCFYAKLKEKMFPITPDMLRKAHLVKQDATVNCGAAAHHCILRELAFGAARFIVKGMNGSVLDQNGSLKLEFSDPHEVLAIDGRFTKFEQTVNHPEVAIVSFTFADMLPLSYKTRFSDYITTLRSEKAKPPVQTFAPETAEPASLNEGESEVNDTEAAAEAAKPQNVEKSVEKPPES